MSLEGPIDDAVSAKDQVPRSDDLSSPVGGSPISRSPGTVRAFVQRQGDDLIRDAIVGGAIALVVFGAAMWWDGRLANRQEVLENTRFVRQVAIDSPMQKPLAGLNLQQAQLRGLNLGCAIPYEGWARRAERGCADFMGADLSGADLFLANLAGADLSAADLSDVDLRLANLEYADLSWADLRGADLGSTDLSGANLENANLAGAHLRATNLSGVDLSRANNTKNADISSICVDASTQLPDDLRDAISYSCPSDDWWDTSGDG